MTKMKIAFAIILATILIIFIGAGGSLMAFAEETSEPPAVEETELTDVAEQFTKYLKDKYGADYEFYYNAIIEQWGSIEGYLLAFGNKLPEEYQSGWEKFINWLNEYAVIWATALAVVVLVIATVIGKNKITKLKEWLSSLIEKLVNKRLAPIENELNLQSKATASILHSQKALLGSAEKFADTVKELEEADKELSDG